MIFPVKQPHKITQKFSKNHPGIDIAPVIAGTKGVPCLAPEASTVYRSAYNASPEGHYIILKGKSVYYYFGHFERRLVSQGQSVGEGQAIGVLGKTGTATGIHTHHEVRPFGPGPGKSIDPEKYYKDNEGEPDVGRVLNKGDIINIWRDKLPGKTPPDNYIKYWTGKEALDMLNDLRKNVPEWSKAGPQLPPVTTLKPGFYKVQ